MKVNLSPCVKREGRQVGLFELGSVSEKPGTKDRASLYSDSLLDWVLKWTKYKFSQSQAFQKNPWVNITST